MDFFKVLLLLGLLGAALADDDSNKTVANTNPGLVEGCVINCRPAKRFFRHPSDFRKYIQCTPYGPQEMLCPENTIWDQKKKTCNHETSLETWLGFYKTPTGSRCPGECQFTCPSKSGRFPHPRDCRMFFQCRESILQYRRCGKNLQFDTKTNKCTEPSLATCTANPDAAC